VVGFFRSHSLHKFVILTYAHRVSMSIKHPLQHLNRLKFAWALLASLLFASAWADEIVEIKHTEVFDGQNVTIQGHLRRTAQNNDERSPAVVLIHSAGGWTDGTTTPVAKRLNAAGFHTLELRFFPTNKQISEHHLLVRRTYAALAYLANLPDVDPERIGIAGFSLGAHLSIWTTAEILTAKFGKGHQFAAHVPVYPVCWLQSQLLRGFMGNAGRRFDLPADFLSRFTGKPVKILAAGLDDYDARDPKACEDFVNQIPEDSRKSFEVQTYLEATHGWNQKTRSFFEPIACKGRGCTNHNVFNPSVTEQSNLVIVNFFVETLKP
jgi:dienelactone hydrolase